MNKATAFLTVTLPKGFFAPCKLALLLLILLYATNSHALTSAKPAYPGHGPEASCRNPHRGQDRFGDTVPRCASSGLSNKKWGGRYDKVEQMYERKVEDPCVAEGLPAGCTYNNAFKPQIRVSYRQCFGIPTVVDVDSRLRPTKWSCGGYELIGKTDLQVSECNFNMVNRFCARVAFPGSSSNSNGSYGNRTGTDPDYRTSGTPYSSSTPTEFKLTNGGVITIANNKVTAYTNGRGDSGIDELSANTYTSFNLLDEEGNDIKTSLLIKKVDAVGGSDPFGSSKSYMVVMPRQQLCAYEDPADMSDPAWSKWSPFHELTPRNSAFSFLSTGNGLSFGENLGVGIGATVAVAVIMPVAAPAAVLIALVALQQSYYNLDVTTNLGCVEIALAPPPPPYPDILTSPRPLPAIQSICAAGQTSEATGCVMPKTGESANSFTVPRIRMGFNNLIPTCTAGQTPTYEIPCVTIENDAITGGIISAAGLSSLTTQLTNIKNADGDSLASSSIRPSYDNGTLNEITKVITYSINGILVGHYNDFDLSFGVDTNYKDYRARDPETDAISPNLQHSVKAIVDPYSNNRTFFNCLSSDATQVCGYELIDVSQSAAGAAALCQISILGNPNKVRPISCVNRVTSISPTVTSLTECIGNALDCSSHTRPLMSVAIGNETLTFGTVTDKYIDAKVLAGQTVNPITSTPSGGYSQCRYLGGMEFCAIAVDANGDSYEDQADVNFVQDNTETGYGYKRGGKKLCLMLPDTLQPADMVLTKKFQPKDVDGNPLTDETGSPIISISTKTADRLVLNYLFPHTPPIEQDRIKYDDNSVRTAAPDDTTGTVLNSNEALRKRKAAEVGYCVNIPAPIYTPCAATTDTTTGARWTATAAAPTATAPAIAGTCPGGSSGSPTRKCTETYDAANNNYYGTWSAVTGSCTPDCSAVSYTSDGTTSYPNPAESTYSKAHGNASWQASSASAPAVQGTCRPGWKSAGANGKPTRTCTATGTWSAVTNACTWSAPYCPNEKRNGCWRSGNGSLYQSQLGPESDSCGTSDWGGREWACCDGPVTNNVGVWTKHKKYGARDLNNIFHIIYDRVGPTCPYAGPALQP